MTTDITHWAAAYGNYLRSPVARAMQDLRAAMQTGADVPAAVEAVTRAWDDEIIAMLSRA